MNSICVYCGSSDRVHPEYTQAAYQMGQAIARRGWKVIYGAGKTGLMGAVANGALDAGGEVVGVIPTLFNTPVLAHAHLTRLEVVPDMHQRKARLISLADALVALPGGFGTFEELFEALTWAQIGLHSKPVGLLNARRYYDPLLAAITHAHQEGMIYAEHRSLFVHHEDPDELLNALANHQSPDGLEQWLSRES